MKLKLNHLLIKKLCIAFIGCILLFAACKPKDPDCYQSILVLNYSKFQVPYNDTQRIKLDSNSSIIDTVVKIKDSIMNYPEMLVLNEDSAYVILAKEVIMLSSPFNPAKESIRYRFTTDTTTKLYDTITYFYTPTTHFISNNCGYTYYYNLDSVKTTKNMLDSSSIVIPSLTDKNTEANVIFYFKKRP